MSTTQKKQHYVWRYHLESWATDGVVYWYSVKQKKGSRGSPRSLAYGKYFYKTERLTDVDKRYMEVFINTLPRKDLRDALLRQLQLFQAPHTLQDFLQGSEIQTPARFTTLIKEKTEIFVKTIGEQWHEGIEARAIPLLNMLRNKDATFWADQEQCRLFLYFLCHQLFRTPKMKHVYEQVQDSVYIDGLDMRRLWVIESLMFATILGANLFVEREQYKLSFINSASDTSFITSDQPVINLKSHGDRDVSLYFPLSPTLAMKLSKAEVAGSESSTMARQLATEYYNHAIYRDCYDQIYGNNAGYLAQIAKLPRELDT